MSRAPGEQGRVGVAGGSGGEASGRLDSPEAKAGKGDRVAGEPEHRSEHHLPQSLPIAGQAAGQLPISVAVRAQAGRRAVDVPVGHGRSPAGERLAELGGGGDPLETVLGERQVIPGR